MSFKLSPQTRDVLKNFASINTGIIVHPGNVLSTLAPMKQTYSIATVPDEFPTRFAIYDLNRLLGVLSIFDEPEIIFGEDHLTVKEGRRTLRYQYAPENIIVAPPEGKDITIKNPDDVLFSFWLSKDQIQALFKAGGLMKATDLHFSREAVATINKALGPDSYKVELEDVDGDSTESVQLKIENVKIIPGDYDVKVTRRMVEFTSTDEERKQRYVVMVEAGNGR